MGFDTKPTSRKMDGMESFFKAKFTFIHIILKQVFMSQKYHHCALPQHSLMLFTEMYILLTTKSIARGPS